jgi:hypothetical protein
MKKRIFSSILLLALCVVCFGLAGCIKPEVPCENGTYKAVDDGFITGIAKLKNGKYAVYMNLASFYEQNNLIFDGSPPEIYLHYMGKTVKAKEDGCGIYIEVSDAENALIPCVKIEGNDECIVSQWEYDTNFLCPANTFGSYNLICINPAELYESL